MTSDTPTFHQVLKILKQQIDAELPVCEKSLELVDSARTSLIEREFQLVNMRKNAMELSKASGQNGIECHQASSIANISSTTPLQLTPSSSYDPFNRTENKRKNITNSFANIFRRPSSGNSNSSKSSSGEFH